MKKYEISENDYKAIEEHYNKFFTKAGAKSADMVFHEVCSDDMHIDLLVYYPTEEFPYHIVSTIGMSGYTMNAVFPNIELIMFLPKDWKISKEDFENEEWYWPIRLLKVAARLPYTTNSFLEIGHTFSYDENDTPFAKSTDMCSGLITHPTLLDKGVEDLRYGFINRKKIKFLCLTAINKEELDYIYSQGITKFLKEKLVKNGVTDLVVRNKR